MFKKGSIVKIDQVMCNVYSIPIPYGVIENTHYSDGYHIRIIEVCIFDELKVFNHYVMSINPEHLEEI